MMMVVVAGGEVGEADKRRGGERWRGRVYLQSVCERRDHE